MSWDRDHLASVDTLLFRSDLVKVGYFDCAVDHPCFAESAPLDNDVFVMPRKPVWVRRDSGDYHFVEPGAILMHRAGSTLERRRATDFGERTYWFGVRPDIFVEALRRYGLSTDEMGGAVMADLKFRHRLAMFLKNLERDTADDLSAEEEVLTLFHEICGRRAEQVSKPSGGREGTAIRQRRLVDKARAYLDAKLTENIALETVARDVGTSLYHLCRIFREQTGMTMHAYRTQQRLDRVMERLLNGKSDNLTALALDSGFASHSHLSREFHKRVGLPPSAMRSAL